MSEVCDEDGQERGREKSRDGMEGECAGEMEGPEMGVLTLLSSENGMKL